MSSVRGLRNAMEPVVQYLPMATESDVQGSRNAAEVVVHGSRKAIEPAIEACKPLRSGRDLLLFLRRFHFPLV